MVITMVTVRASLGMPRAGEDSVMVGVGTDDVETDTARSPTRPWTTDVLVLHSEPLAQAGIEQVLAGVPGVCLTFVGDSPRLALAAVDEAKSSLVVLDVDLRARTPIADVVAAFVARGVPVICLSTSGAPHALRTCLAAGSDALVSVHAPIDELVRALRAVLKGESWCSPDLAHALELNPPSVDLSEQQRRALVLYTSGLTMEVVARRMGVTTSTAKDYIDRVRVKYVRAGFASRTKIELYAAAQSQGLIA